MRLASKKLITTVVGGSMVVAGVGAALAPAAQAAPFRTATYDAAGTTHIGGGVNADASLGPATLTTTVDLGTGQISNGTLPLPPTVVNFKALGAVPIRATVNFIPVGKISGNLSSDASGNTVVTANAAYTIKLTNVSAQFFPFTPYAPLNVGNNCQTVNPVSLNLKTPAGQSFSIGDGGTVTSRYTIGQFNNCNVIVFPNGGSFIVNALVPNSNNTATVTLSNGRLTNP